MTVNKHHASVKDGKSSNTNISRRSLLVTGGTALAGGLVLARGGFALAADKAVSGDALFKTVSAFASLGDHRTGTEVDKKTVEWLSHEFASRGATVSLQEYDIDRFDSKATVRIDGVEVPSIPLYYQAVGHVSSDKPYHGDVEVSDNRAATLEALLTGARQAKATAAVFATTGAGGHLMVTNRNPKLGEGPATMLIPGSLASKLAKGKVSVEYDASITPAKTANLIARFGDQGQQMPLIITTQMNGWFKCAGQHGSSIAIALEVASALSKMGPVIVIATSGSELNAAGVRYYMRNNPLKPQGILYLGSNLASAKPDKTGKLVLADKLSVTTSLGGQNMAKVSKAVKDLTDKVKFNLDADAKSPDMWRGESRVWCRFDAPLLAISGAYGAFPLNGTPDDTPDKATTPALLAEVCTAVIEAGQLLFAPK